MSNVVNDDLVRSDFVYDQVIADRKSSEFGIACCCSKYGCSAISAVTCSIRATGWAAALRLSFAMYANLFEVGERTAFEPELHALRSRLNSGSTSSSLARSRRAFLDNPPLVFADVVIIAHALDLAGEASDFFLTACGQVNTRSRIS
jgi:hypothetical protein